MSANDTFRMSLFFAVAGFFGYMLLEKRGAGGFARNRAKRIALPFLVFWPLMLACLVGVALGAAGYAGTGPFATSAAEAEGPTPAAAAVATPGGVLALLLHRLPLGHTSAFAFGWFLHRQAGLLDGWRRSWLLYLVAAALLSYYCAKTMSAATRNPAPLSGDAGASLLRAFAYPLATWSWCLALIGMATRFLSEERRVVRYLSDSSYWIYLAHLPLVVALQVLASPWNV
jgi:hypothetical protein